MSIQLLIIHGKNGLLGMINLKSATVDELLDELKSREGVYYEEARLSDDPVLNVEKGLIQIYDLRKEWELYNRE